MKDLTILFYTANHVSDYFMGNVTKQLLKAAGDTQIISISQKPMALGTNICLGDIGRSKYNIYKQILIGAKAATTKYVATAEDDVLYPREHFEYRPTNDDVFAYDMSKWSVFTWSKPQRFSYREGRRTMTSLVVARDALVKTLEERYNKYPDPEKIDSNLYNLYWGEPGRFEDHLGITKLKTESYKAAVPSIIFSTPKALGFEGLGTRKAHGGLVQYEVAPWGKAEDIAKLYA